MYRRFLAPAIAAGCALAASNAVAAPERVRGTIAGVSGDTLTVDTAAGQTVPVTLTDSTRYLKVAPSSLNHVDPGAYIGTATKSGDLPAVPEGYGRGPLRLGPHSGYDALGRRDRA